MIGIIGAMQEEIDCLIGLLENVKIHESNRRNYYQGILFGKPTVVVFSRWGKVAAAITATHLLNHYKVKEIIFIGVAGAICDHLNIGDVVVAKRLIQHDMDASPLLPQYEIPLLHKAFFEVQEERLSSVFKSVRLFLENLPESLKNELTKFSSVSPKVQMGDIASGDKFFSDTASKTALKKSIPSVLCVEMEGAAVAQVCYEFSVPLVVIRTISDTSDENSVVSFPEFVSIIANQYTYGIISQIYKDSEG